MGLARTAAAPSSAIGNRPAHRKNFSAPTVQNRAILLYLGGTIAIYGNRVELRFAGDRQCKWADRRNPLCVREARIRERTNQETHSGIGDDPSGNERAGPDRNR